MTHRIEVFEEQDVVADGDLAALWQRETGMPDDEVARRMHEVLLVALDDDELVGISSAFLQRSERLRMDLWHYRVFVVGTRRRTTVGLDLLNRGREHLEERFTSGRDRRAAGLLGEIENEELMGFNPAVWPRTRMTFIGVNERGWHVRVRWFPGALAPEP